MRSHIVVVCLVVLTSWTTDLWAGLFSNDTYKVGPVAYTTTIPAGYELYDADAYMALDFAVRGLSDPPLMELDPRQKYRRFELSRTVVARQAGTVVTVEIEAGEMSFDLPLSDVHFTPLCPKYTVTLVLRNERDGNLSSIGMNYFGGMDDQEGYAHARTKRLERRIARFFGDRTFHLWKGDFRYRSKEDERFGEVNYDLGNLSTLEVYAYESAMQEEEEERRKALFEQLHGK